ncbi:MAG: heme-dependent oxidative N-demethylase family protein [Gemmobacter sp.]
MPLDMADWLRVDDAYAGQMALRDRLTDEVPDQVHGVLPMATAAADELYGMVLPLLPRLGFRLTDGAARRPDGVEVPLDPARPLMTLGRLCQNDFCLMQANGQGEHLLSAAILCFPAGWRLSEKLGLPMMRIHLPVAKYTPDVGRRVQRLMDAVRPGAPLWRANGHRSRAPLFNPLSEADPKDAAEAEMPFIRSERQCMIRLPVSGAVVFSIHTYLLRVEDLTPAQAQALAAHPIHRSA